MNKLNFKKWENITRKLTQLTPKQILTIREYFRGMFDDSHIMSWTDYQVIEQVYDFYSEKDSLGESKFIEATSYQLVKAMHYYCDEEHMSW